MTDRELLIAITKSSFGSCEDLAYPVVMAMIKAHLENDPDAEKFVELMIKSYKDYSNMRNADWDLIEIMERKYS